MKRSIISLSLAIAVLVGIAVAPAFAQEISRTVTLRRDAKLGGQVLPKGDYSVKYAEGKGELVFSQGKHEVLTATYKLSKLDKTPDSNLVIYSEQDDGSFQLKRIEFKGKDSALVFENTVAKAISK
jgi:hypothetical protein